MEGLEVNMPHCYWNWTLKAMEGGHVQCDKKARGLSITKTEKHKTYFRHKEDTPLAGLKDLEGSGKRWSSETGRDPRQGETQKVVVMGRGNY